MVHEKGWVQATECFQGTFPDRPDFGTSNRKRGKSISIWLIFLLISKCEWITPNAWTHSRHNCINKFY